MGSALKAEIIESKIKQTATLIFLHGLGDNGSGWASILEDVVPKYCKIICPHAPTMPVTLNGGARMPSWFDIFDLSPQSKQDVDGIKKASKDLEGLVRSEVDKGIPEQRIVIGGFSQGGAIALYTALTGAFKNLAAVMALSSWLPIHTEFQSNPAIIQMKKSVPILQCHGEVDPLVPVQMGQMSNMLLKASGLTDCTFKAYPGLVHSSCPEEMKDVKMFLEKIIPSQ